jgi:hypothetical protein
LGGSPKRYASHVHGKWHIIWQWSDDYGAHEMSLERL